MSRSVVVRLLLAASLIAAFSTGCSRDPNVRKQKYLDSGNRFRDRGKFREAAIQYSNAAQVDPRFAEAHFQLGEVYLKLKDYRRAFAELSRTLELNPDNFQAHVDVANLLISNQQPKDAQPHLDFLREKQPDSPDTHEAWANFYAVQGNLGAAMQEMQRGIASDPGRSESYLNLALLQLRSNLLDQAEANFKKAAETGPKAMNAQLALGGFYETVKRLPEAEQQYKHAIDVDSKDPVPRAAYVRLLMFEGKKNDAEAFLKQTKRDLSDVSEGYRMLGDFYFANGELDAATTEYGSLYSDHPKDPGVKKNYIQLLILKSRLDEAGKLNNEILKTTPHDVEALIYKGEIQNHKNDAGAVDTLQQALKYDPDNAVGHYQLGIAFDQQRNDARAEAEWQEAMRLRPDLTDAARALAAVEIRRGDVDALARTSEQIIASAPQSADGYLLRGLAAMNRQKYADAEQDLRKASTLAPQSPAPDVQMGNLRAMQKQNAEALKFYQQALGKDAANIDGLRGIMNVYLGQKQPDQAIAAANAQIAKAPNVSGFYDLLGTALFVSKKDYQGADTAFRKSMEVDPNNFDAILKLGQAMVAEGSVDQALATYQEALKKNPRDAAICILAGEMYESKGSWDQAKAMYQQALTIEPDNALASNNLAYVILNQGGNVDVALAMAQTARRGMPDSPNAADTLGWAYYQKGIYQSAIDMFQESLRLNEKHGAPDEAVVHYHLGLAYQKANQPVQARQQLERVLKLNPKDADARKALSELRG